MKPRSFDYIRPDNLAEAVAVLAEYGEQARVLAGGQSLMAMLNFRLLDPSVILDIAGMRELDYVRQQDGMLEIGAALTQDRLLAWPQLHETVPLLAQALPWVGHFQTRNRGTVCGSIAHADPSSELPLVLATLQGEVVLCSSRGARTVSAATFQRGMLSTDRAADELVTAVRFPVGMRRTAFREVARRHGDFAIVAMACVAEKSGAVRLGVAGVADRPTLTRLEDFNEDALAKQLNAFAWELHGYDDVHATARYRRDLVRKLAPALIKEALACVV